MNEATKPTSVAIDVYTRCCLTAIAVLLTVLVLGLWAESPIRARAAQAAPAAVGGMANSSAQRQAMVNALGRTNEKLDRIISLLESGKIKVILARPEVKHATPKPPAPKPRGK